MSDVGQVFLDVNQRFAAFEKVQEIRKQLFEEILSILVCFTRLGNRFQMIELLQIGEIIDSLNEQRCHGALKRKDLRLIL